jgi:ribosomal protein L37E
MNRTERRKSLTDGREIRASLYRMLPPGYRMQLFGPELDKLETRGVACAACGGSRGTSRTAVTWADADTMTFVYAFAVACKTCLGNEESVHQLATRLVVEPMRASREIHAALHKMLPPDYRMQRCGRELHELEMRGATCAACGAIDGNSRTSFTWVEPETKTLFYIYAIACETCLKDESKVHAQAMRMIVEPLRASRPVTEKIEMTPLVADERTPDA